MLYLYEFKTMKVTLIICLKGERKKSPSYLVDENLTLIRSFKSTYKKGKYIPTINKLMNKDCDTIFGNSFENGINKIKLEKRFVEEMKRRELDGIPNISDEEIDKLFKEII